LRVVPGDKAAGLVQPSFVALPGHAACLPPSPAKGKPPPPPTRWIAASACTTGRSRDINRDEESMNEWISSSAAVARPKRALWQALGRGFACRCPACGQGRLFHRYLKAVDHCDACGEDLSHQQADDAPPYFTITIVAHIVVPLMLLVEMTWHLSNMTHLAIWLPLTALLTIGLLQPVKGSVVGLQWALYMHGFDPDGDPDEHGLAPRAPDSR
jgi:uncharacterized protein (DUF983 family)